MRFPLLWMASLVGGCSGGGGGFDAPIPDAPILDAPAADARSDAPPPDASIASLSCDQLSAAVGARLRLLDDSCQTVNDCTTIIHIVDWCDAYPQIVLVVSKTAAADPDLQALVGEWDGRCKHAPCGVTHCIADTPPPTPACSLAQRCVDTHQNSCNPMPDAAP
jgi:hypothetical protein